MAIPEGENDEPWEFVHVSSEKWGVVSWGMKGEETLSYTWPGQSTEQQHAKVFILPLVLKLVVRPLDALGILPFWTLKTLRRRCSLQPFTVPFWAIVRCVFFFFFAAPCCDLSAGCSAALRSGFVPLNGAVVDGRLWKDHVQSVCLRMACATSREIINMFVEVPDWNAQHDQHDVHHINPHVAPTFFCWF